MPTQIIYPSWFSSLLLRLSRHSRPRCNHIQTPGAGIPRAATAGYSSADMNSSTEQLYAILNRKWQPDDDDRYVLELDGPEPDGKCKFAWIDTAHAYPPDRPEPSIGEWSMEARQCACCRRA